MMMNLTQCEGRCEKCLGESVCCYECDYKSWCDGRCLDTDCRRTMVKRRLNKDDTIKKTFS